MGAPKVEATPAATAAANIYFLTAWLLSIFLNILILANLLATPAAKCTKGPSLPIDRPEISERTLPAMSPQKRPIVLPISV